MKPKKLRIKTGDGEERVIAMSKGRILWHDVANTVATAEAVSVECLAEDDTIIRATKLTDDDVESFETEKDDGSKNLSKAMRDQAAMLDAYGRRMNEAFARGADAASTAQDKLVQLVETLTTHLTLAITNVNNLSVNYANALQASGQNSGGDGEESNSAKMLQSLLALAAGSRTLPAPAPDTKANGKK